jgi:hypothetical protein
MKLVLGAPTTLARFITEHQEHSFTGLRVVKVDNPCPNRARHYTLVEPTAGDPPDIEALADAEHESWSGWTKWMLSKIEEELKSAAEGGKKPFYYDALLAVNQTENVQRWRRHRPTTYTNPPEREKDSDRKVVREKLQVYRSCFK